MKNSHYKIAFVAVAILALIGIITVIAGSKKSNTPTNSNSPAGSSSSAVATSSVTVQNFAFSPADITVKVGTKVTWTNKDAVHHSVVADTNSNDAPNGPLFGQNESYSFTFNKAGTYNYHCAPHPYMHGTVTVTN